MTDTITIIRAVIEFTAPLSIGAGAYDLLVDAPVVVDADGLPALPGSSLAGVLRAAALRTHAERDVDDWFGQRASSRQSATASSLWVSWGRPHGAADQPVAPCAVSGHDHKSDRVLDFLRAQVLRDRVRLNERGVVAEKGKYDQSFVPAGARFTVELRIDGDALDAKTVLGWLASASLGRSTGAGFGQVRIVRAASRRFQLRVDADRQAYLRHPRALWVASDALADMRIDAEATAWPLRFALTLRPEHGLLIGGRADEAGDGADLVPFCEKRVLWPKSGGVVKSHFILPGSALRGALSHRTRFHLGVIQQHELPELVVDEAHEALFGSDPGRKPTDDPDSEALKAGRLIVPETLLPDGALHHQMHVSLDRFTQGPRDGMLFEEQVLWLDGQVLSIAIGVDAPAATQDLANVDDVHRPLAAAIKAFRRALVDLTEGTLGLGHANARGHGFFTGTFVELGASAARKGAA